MTKKTGKAMASFLAVWADKMFGQYIEHSSTTNEKELYEEAIKTFANDLHKSAYLAGQKMVPHSGQIYIKPKSNNAFADPLGNHATIGAKIRTVMSATPEQFIAYAAFRLEDARNEAKAAKQLEKEADQRFNRLYDVVHKAKRLKSLRHQAELILEDEYDPEQD